MVKNKLVIFCYYIKYNPKILAFFNFFDCFCFITANLILHKLIYEIHLCVVNVFHYHI
jgi:hypothetical protein